MTVATSTRGESGGDDRRDLRRHSTASAPLGGVTAARGGALAFVRGLCRIPAFRRHSRPCVVRHLVAPHHAPPPHILQRQRLHRSSKIEGGSYVIHARATPG